MQNYALSNSIHVYPCANRGKGHDLESKIMTEYNNVHLSSVGHKRSFTLSYDTTTSSLLFVIGGYFVNLNLTGGAGLELNGDYKNLTAHITLVDKSLTENTENKTKVLAKYSDSSVVESLDISDGTKDRFYGIYFDTNPNNTDGTHNLQLFDGNGDLTNKTSINTSNIDDNAVTADKLGSVIKTNSAIANGMTVALSQDNNKGGLKIGLSGSSADSEYATKIGTKASQTAIGSATKPVYISNDGTVVAISYNINKDVPSNAEFTDTKVTTVGNHYAPEKDASATKTASGGTATDATGSSNAVQVITGIEMDAKGHVTGVVSKGVYSTDTDTHNSHTVISGKKSDDSTDITSTASSGDITLGDSGVTAGEYGPTANATPAYGATFNVPDIKVNAKGIVTAISNRTVKIPASDNTDTTLSGVAYCSNDSPTSSLTATLPGFALKNDQQRILIYITDDSSVTSTMTLNVNSTGAKTLWVNGSSISSTNPVRHGLYCATYRSSGPHWELVPAVTAVAIGNNDYISFKNNPLQWKSQAAEWPTTFPLIGKFENAGGTESIRQYFPFNNATEAWVADLGKDGFTVDHFGDGSSIEEYHENVFSLYKKSDGTYGCSVGGTMSATSYNATSDIRRKENIREYSPEKSILDLEIKKFDFIDGRKNQIGCIAQDLQEICPEIVDEDEKGYLSIQESKLVYLLLDEVKKLRKELDELKGE